MKRRFFEKITHFCKGESTTQVLLVEGARQVGKTFGVKSALEELDLPIVQINFEENKIFLNKVEQTREFSEFEFLLKQDFGFDPNRPSVLFIDECQESKKIGGYVRTFHERWKNVKTILTGSSTALLFSTHRNPVGRYQRLRVTPFSFKEFLEFQSKKALVEVLDNFTLTRSEIPHLVHQTFLEEFDNYLELGGLPGVLLAYKNGLDYRDFRLELILSQREDFLRKTNAFEASLFDAALSATAQHVGSPAKYTHLDAPYRQSKSIVSLLVEWFILRQIERHGTDPNKSEHTPKRYLYDLGVLKYFQARPLQSIKISDAGQPSLRTYLGGVLENAVLIELEQFYFNKGTISTWIDGSNTRKEVDFVVDHAGKSIPIEVKATLRTTNRHFKNCLSYLETTGEDLGVLVSPSPFKTLQNSSQKKLINLPIYLLSEFSKIL